MLAHLADCAIAFGFRVRKIISEPQLPIQPFDQDLWARFYSGVNGLEAAKTFQTVRAWNLALFRLLSKDDLDKTANHRERDPEKAETVIRIMAGHTLNHLAQLEKVLAVKGLWPTGSTDTTTAKPAVLTHLHRILHQRIFKNGGHDDGVALAVDKTLFDVDHWEVFAYR